MDKSTISAFQKTCLTFKFPDPKTFGEAFAQRRYRKKLELPDDSRSTERREAAWSAWIAHDSNLELQFPLPGVWYRVRADLHRLLSDFRLGPVSFTNGSEFTPVLSGSVQTKLEKSRWECTPQCFDLWAKLAYGHKALKRAVKMRWRRHKSQMGWSKFVEAQMFKEECNKSPNMNKGQLGFAIFRRKLSFLTTVIRGNRFSTVRKNNEVDRPICLEGLCNMLVQRTIGLGLRDIIKRRFGVDLTYAQEIHRALVSTRDIKIATIDLKNASDSISLELVEFLLPKKVFNLVRDSRAEMTLGLDGQYHIVRKVSSMGNGFTFELMSLILLTMVRQLSQFSFVYGDDIIVRTSESEEVIRLLTAVGFVVNENKTFVDGPFKESCGSNYHMDEGYIESFDFEFPESIPGTITFYNKVVKLGHIYESFRRLAACLLRSLPPALHGSYCTSDRIDAPFLSARRGEIPVSRKVHGSVSSALNHLQIRGEPRFFLGHSMSGVVLEQKRGNLNSRNWAKYEMYLSSLRRTEVVQLRSESVKSALFVEAGSRVFRVRDLVP